MSLTCSRMEELGEELSRMQEDFRRSFGPELMRRSVSCASSAAPGCSAGEASGPQAEPRRCGSSDELNVGGQLAFQLPETPAGCLPGWLPLLPARGDSMPVQRGSASAAGSHIFWHHALLTRRGVELTSLPLIRARLGEGLVWAREIWIHSAMLCGSFPCWI
uniref:Uncharacterized protein n=1 Tax=Tetraselmis sp. GSL018 TaxID=582737 RepID=A0A061QZJ2_9CHLO